MAALLQASIPLAEVFPWSLHQDPSTILILDSLESDGRFLLYEIAAQVVSSNSTSSTTAAPSLLPRSNNSAPAKDVSRVLWLSGSPITPRLIRNALKRIGCPVLSGSVAPGAVQSSTDRLVLRSLTEELGTALLHMSLPNEGRNEKVSNPILDREDWVRKHLLASISQWVDELPQPANATKPSVSWIILDDMATLVTLLGERLMAALVQSVQSLCLTGNVGLVVRCAREDDISQIGDVTDVSSSPGDWMGASGATIPTGSRIPWQSLFVELSDHVVDVCPLPSGPTREAHGRLLMSHVEHGHVSACNYCLTDTKALAIRLCR